MFTAHGGFARLPGREVGNQLHDVVVIDGGRSEEHELEIELLQLLALFITGLGALVSQASGRL
ncbi:hypothetical protein D3C85_1681270 [compost metagenome]